MKKRFLERGNDKKAGIAILISDKIDFKTKAIKKKKDIIIIMKGGISTRRGYHTC